MHLLQLKILFAGMAHSYVHIRLIVIYTYVPTCDLLNPFRLYVKVMMEEKCCQRNQAIYHGLLQLIIRDVKTFVCHVGNALAG